MDRLDPSELPAVHPDKELGIIFEQLALTFGVAVFVGRLFDMGIFKVPAICASVAIVVLTILIAECRQYWQFLLCQGIALGTASGVLFGPTLAVVAHWCEYAFI